MGGGGQGGVRLTARVRGRVQGVGFRWWTAEQADALGVAGSARNLRDGSVEVVAEGPRPAVEALLSRLRDGDVPGRPGRVEEVTEQWGPPAGAGPGFTAR